MSQQPQPVSMVLVGLNFGRHIFRHLLEPPAKEFIQLVGVCDLDQDKAHAMVANHPQLKVYPTLDDVLADERVQAVGLYCGPKGRAALLDKIISAGKDVMTTKPFEVDPQAAMDVLQKAHRIGRVIHLNSPSPGVSQDLAVIEKWQRELDLGRPVGARADVWVSYREQTDGRWQDDPTICPAAPVFRLGIYLINDLVGLMGRIDRIHVMSSRLFTGRPTADNAQLGIAFANGALANIFASFCVEDGDHYRNALTVNYERGTIYRNVGPHCDGDRATLSVIKGSGSVQRQIIETQHVQLVSGLYDWQGFVQAVRHEPDAPTYELDHIIEPLRVIEALAEAEQSGKQVVIEH